MRLSAGALRPMHGLSQRVPVRIVSETTKNNAQPQNTIKLVSGVGSVDIRKKPGGEPEYLVPRVKRVSEYPVCLLLLLQTLL